MIYFWYILLAFLNLIVTFVALLIAPVLPLFAGNTYGWCDNHRYQDFGSRLPTWLNWFMTPDNDLYGDATFQNTNGKNYWSMVKWLWRNPAYSFGLRYLNAPYDVTVKGDPSIKDNDGAKAGWCLVKANGLFQFRWVKQTGPFTCAYWNFGWNIMGLADPNVNPKPDPYQATFVFSPRRSGFR